MTSKDRVRLVTNAVLILLTSIGIGISLAAMQGCSFTATVPYPWQSSAVEQTSKGNHK